MKSKQWRTGGVDALAVGVQQRLRQAEGPAPDAAAAATPLLRPGVLLLLLLLLRQRLLQSLQSGEVRPLQRGAMHAVQHHAHGTHESRIMPTARNNCPGSADAEGTEQVGELHDPHLLLLVQGAAVDV